MTFVPFPLLERDHTVNSLREMFKESCRVVLHHSQSEIPLGWGLSSIANDIANSPDLFDGIIEVNTTEDIPWQASLLRLADRFQFAERYVRTNRRLEVGLRRVLHERERPLIIIDGHHPGDLLLSILDDFPHTRVLMLAGAKTEIDQTESRLASWKTVLVKPIRSRSFSQELLGNEDGEELASLLQWNPMAMKVAAAILSWGEKTPAQLIQELADTIDCGVALCRILHSILHQDQPGARAVLASFAQAADWVLPRQMLSALWPSSEALDAPIDQLVRYGLIRVSHDGSLVAMPHSLQTWIREAWPRDHDEPWRRALSEKIISAGEDPTIAWQLAPHIALAVERMNQNEELSDTDRNCFALAADLCQRIGATSQACKYAKSYSTMQQGSTQPAHVKVAALQRLAQHQRFAGKNLHSRKTAREALKLMTKEGLNYPRLHMELECHIAEIDIDECRVPRALKRIKQLTAMARHQSVDPSLLCWIRFLKAACFLAGKRPDAALKLFRDVIEDQIDRLGIDDVQTLRTRVLLARTYFALGQQDEALKTVQEDWSIRSRSPRVSLQERSIPLNFLAELLDAQGELDLADQRYEELYQMRRLIWGSQHRSVGEAAARLATIKAKRGDYQASEPLFREALHKAEQTYGSSHPYVAKMLNDLGEMLFARGTYDPARRVFERALRIQLAALRNTHPQISRTRANLAAVYVARGMFPHAERLYREDLTAKRESLPADHPTLATVLNNLGDVCRSLGHWQDAERYLTESLEIRERLFGRRHISTAQSLNNIGVLYLCQGQLDPARGYLEEAIDIRRSLLGNHHPHLANSLTLLGRLLIINGCAADALKLLEEAYDICNASLGPDHSQTGHILSVLGRAECILGHMARAELHLLKSQKILTEAVGPQHRLTGMALYGLGELAESENRIDFALQQYETALSCLQPEADAMPIELAEIQMAIGRCRMKCGQTEEAGAMIEQSYSCLTNKLPKTCPLRMQSLLEYAHLALRNEKYEQAEQLAREVVRIQEQDTNQKHVKDHEAWKIMAEAATGLRDYSTAERVLRTLITDKAHPSDASDQSRLQCLAQLAGVLHLKGDQANAVTYAREALDLARTLHGSNHPEVARHCQQLASFLSDSNDPQAAEPYFQECVDILEGLYGAADERLTEPLDSYAQFLNQRGRTSEANRIAERVEGLRHVSSHVLDDLL